MVIGRAIAFTALIVGTLAACADVWGLQTLAVEDASAPFPGVSDASDGQAPRPTVTDGGDGGGAPMAEGGRPPHHVDAAIVTGSDAAPSADAGVCNLDPGIACSDPATIGVTCPSGAQPSASIPGVTCTMQATSGGTTTYCCSGNFCQDTEDTSLSADCASCWVTSCAAPDCLCANTGTVVDDAGDTQCGDYIFNDWEGCFFPPGGPTAQQCESQYSAGFPSPVVTAGNADVSCLSYYCSGPCQF